MEGIVREYPEINMIWLLTGEGDMIHKNVTNIKPSVDSQRYNVSDLGSCKEVLAEKDRMINELRDTLEHTRKEKDKLYLEVERFWAMFRHLTGAEDNSHMAGMRFPHDDDPKMNKKDKDNG